MSNLMFFGTPDFAVLSLQALHDFCLKHHHQLVGVVCRPDKPSERGHHLHEPAVKVLAKKLGLPVFQPVKITSEFVTWFQGQNIDLGVVVAYGKILPQSLLDASKLGFINVHASLLPRWRGAAPIQRAIEAGDAETGVCIMKLVAELDAGDVYHTVKTSIKPLETSGELFERLSILGAQALGEALPGILSGQAVAMPQEIQSVTYAHRLKKEEACIDWTKSAEQIVNHVRAMHPWPGSYTFYRGKKIRLFKAKVAETELSPRPPRLGPGWIPGQARDDGVIDSNDAASGKPGQIQALGSTLTVAAAHGSVSFEEAQLEGRRRMPIQALLNGFEMQVGEDLC